MADVQDLMLATTEPDAKKAMTHLTNSYQHVLQQKVPTASAIADCRSAAADK